MSPLSGLHEADVVYSRGIGGILSRVREDIAMTVIRNTPGSNDYTRADIGAVAIVGIIPVLIDGAWRRSAPTTFFGWW